MVVTTLGYICHQDEVLMLHRVKKKHDINQDKWIGIGGKLENGETVLACMKRECREETGLDWKDPTLRAIITFNFRKNPEDELFSELMFLYTGTDYEGSLADCPEGDLVWKNWQQIRELNLWKGDLIFIYYMQTSIPLFYMELNYLADKLVSATLNDKPVDLSDPRWNVPDCDELAEA